MGDFKGYKAQSHINYLYAYTERTLVLTKSK